MPWRRGPAAFIAIREIQLHPPAGGIGQGHRGHPRNDIRGVPSRPTLSMDDDDGDEEELGVLTALGNTSRQYAVGHSIIRW